MRTGGTGDCMCHTACLAVLAGTTLACAAHAGTACAGRYCAAHRRVCARCACENQGICRSTSREDCGNYHIQGCHRGPKGDHGWVVLGTMWDGCMYMTPNAVCPNNRQRTECDQDWELWQPKSWRAELRIATAGDREAGCHTRRPCAQRTRPCTCPCRPQTWARANLCSLVMGKVSKQSPQSCSRSALHPVHTTQCTGSAKD